MSMLLFFYFPSLYKSVKIKKYWHTNNIKMENDELKNVSIKNCMCYYFNDVITIEDFDFDNILLNRKHFDL